MKINFPEKIKMTNSLIEEVKYFIPSLDLTKTGNGKIKGSQNNSNKNNNNYQNTKENTEDFTINKKRNFESEEWHSVMKAVKLTDEEMERFFKNKFISKLIFAIDNLIGFLIEKANLTAQLQNDKSILYNQISVYKKDNVTLTQNYLEIKNKIKAFEDKKSKEKYVSAKTLKDNENDNNELDSSLVKLDQKLF
jgi:cell division protein FtsB